MGIHDDLQRGIHITPGDGIVAKLDDFLAFAIGDDAGLNQLIVRLNALAGADWSEIVRTLTADIVAAGYEHHPQLACVQVRHDRVGVLVFGSMQIDVATDGDHQVLDGSDSNTWIDVAVHGSPRRIVCGEQSESNVVGVLRDGVVPAGGYMLDPARPIPASTRWDEFEAVRPAPTNGGVSSNGAEGHADVEVDEDEDVDTEDVTFFPTVPPIPVAELPEPPSDEEATTNAGLFGRLNDLHSEPPEFPPPAVMADELDAEADSQKADSDETGSDDSADDARAADGGDESSIAVPQPPPIVWPAEPPPTPVVAPSPIATARATQVHGVLCPDGHLTSVRDRHCRTCGKRPDPSGELQIGPRPTLGTITFDDGAVLPIDRPAIIGHDVDPGYEISGEPATIALIGDDAGTIAPLHAEVRLIGWDVEVVALSADAPVYTRLERARGSRTKLRPGIPTVLESGTVVELGGRTFVFAVGPAVGAADDQPTSASAPISTGTS